MAAEVLAALILTLAVPWLWNRFRPCYLQLDQSTLTIGTRRCSKDDIEIISTAHPNMIAVKLHRKSWPFQLAAWKRRENAGLAEALDKWAVDQGIPVGGSAPADA